MPALKEIKTEGCNIATPPQAICEQGLDAIRRYWAENAAAAIPSVTLKAVLMGAGEAGKTSMLRRLLLAAAAVLPAKDDRTIGIEMAAMLLDPENDPDLKLLMCGAARLAPPRASRARARASRPETPPRS